MAQIFKRALAQKIPIQLDAYKLLSISGLEVVEITFHPGEFLPVHENSVDVIFHVKIGSGILTIGSEKHVLRANDSAFVEKDSLRGWANTGTGDLILLVIKK